MYFRVYKIQVASSVVSLSWCRLLVGAKSDGHKFYLKIVMLKKRSERRGGGNKMEWCYSCTLGFYSLFSELALQIPKDIFTFPSQLLRFSTKHRQNKLQLFRLYLCRLLIQTPCFMLVSLFPPL